MICFPHKISVKLDIASKMTIFGRRRQLYETRDTNHNFLPTKNLYQPLRCKQQYNRPKCALPLDLERFQKTNAMARFSTNFFLPNYQ